jgi:hypothetical protein
MVRIRDLRRIGDSRYGDYQQYCGEPAAVAGHVLLCFGWASANDTVGAFSRANQFWSSGK